MPDAQVPQRKGYDAQREGHQEVLSYPAGNRTETKLWRRFPVDMLVFMPDVTQILAAIETGDPAAAAQLLPMVYDELRQLAAVQMAREKPGQTLSPTALVHEAYLRLVGNDPAEASAARFANRRHFFAVAAEAMRRILVENARRRSAQKRGGDRQRVELEGIAVVTEPPDDELLALDAALDRLAEEDPKKAELVKLRYFAGLTVEQAAEALGISRATADRYWAYSKVWLFAAIHGQGPL